VRAIVTHPGVRRLIAGHTLSTLGDRAMFLVFAIWAKSLTGSNAAGGLAFLAIIGPTALSPFVGLLVDRFRRRPLMIATDLILAAAVLLLLLVRAAGDLWLLYVVAVLYGLGSSLFAAAQSAFLTVMLPAEMLGDANAGLQTVGEGVRLFAPLAGAALFAAAGGGSVAALDAATFVVSALCLATLRVHERPAPRPQHDLRRELIAGMRHVLAPGTLRRVVLTVAGAMLVIGFAETFMFAVIDHGLHRPPSFLGVLSTAQGIGAVVGGLSAGSALRRLGDVRITAVGMVLFALGELALIVPHIGAVLAGLVIAGAGLPWAIVGSVTALQRRTPQALQGRAYAAADALVTTPQTVSIAVGAALSALVDYRLLILATTAVMGACGITLLRPGGLRRRSATFRPFA
jgi:MFS family permease